MPTIYLTTEQAAEELQFADSYVRRLCRQGRLGRRIGRNWAITVVDLRKYQEAVAAKQGGKESTPGLGSP